MLQVNEDVDFDNYITDYEYFNFHPTNITALNENDEVRIPVHTQDCYILPCKSYITLTGSIFKTNNAIYDEKIVMNGFSHLFEDIRFLINGEIIDRTRNPGYVSFMKGICSYDNAQINTLQNAGWDHLNKEIKMLKDGKFNASIPLSHVLGFAEDFQKILINARTELVMLRAKNTTNVTIGSQSVIKLNSIQWSLPIIKVSDQIRLSLIKTLEVDKPLPVAFRSWQLYEYPNVPQSTEFTWNVTTVPQLQKARFAIIGLQTNRETTAANPSQFDLNFLTDVKLFLQDKKYPYNSFHVSYENNIYSALYDRYTSFQSSYYGRNNQPMLNRNDFITKAPVFVIDCSKQNDDIKVGALNIRVEFTTSANLPANTKAFCLIIHDKKITYRPLTGIVNSII